MSQANSTIEVADRVLRGDCVCDSDTTCFLHHDCSDGTCTHTDGDA